MERNILKSNTVNYRKGFIEVKGEIHPGCINIETWEINANKDITGLSLENENIKDEDVIVSALRFFVPRIIEFSVPVFCFFFLKLLRSILLGDRSLQKKKL